MKRSTFLVPAFFLVTTALAKAVVRPSSNQLFRKEYGGTTIDIPLTDSTKNDGKTDLQWYAKVTVGTPPQSL